MKNLKKILFKNNQINRDNELFLLLKSDFTYHSSAIEGSKVTEVDNAIISKLSSETDTEIVATKYKGKYQHDEVIENFNCGNLFEYLLLTIDEPITEKELKVWHNILKKGTKWAIDYSTSYGDYKKLSNVIDGRQTPQPWQVSDMMSTLIKKINIASNTKEIAKCHGDFESIHPFLDGNGRIGRAIMFKQCLQNNLPPIIINNASKRFYYDALKHYQATGKTDILEPFFKEQQKYFENRYSKYLIKIK